jgi:flagellin
LGVDPPTAWEHVPGAVGETEHRSWPRERLWLASCHVHRPDYRQAVQYSDGSLATQDKSAIQGEVNQITQQIDRQQQTVQFNGQNLLDGTAGGSGTVTFQVGANQGDTMSATFSSIEGNLTTGFSWGTNGANAQAGTTVFDLSSTSALKDLSTAINSVSTLAAHLGATQNRLQYTSNSISTTQENLSAANSTIKDVDMASEMTKLTQQQILQQAGTAMLAQANSQPQMILKLLA